MSTSHEWQGAWQPAQTKTGWRAVRQTMGRFLPAWAGICAIHEGNRSEVEDYLGAAEGELHATVVTGETVGAYDRQQLILRYLPAGSRTQLPYHPTVRGPKLQIHLHRLQDGDDVLLLNVVSLAHLGLEEETWQGRPYLYVRGSSLGRWR